LWYIHIKFCLYVIFWMNLVHNRRKRRFINYTPGSTGSPGQPQSRTVGRLNLPCIIVADSLCMPRSMSRSMHVVASILFMNAAEALSAIHTYMCDTCVHSRSIYPTWNLA
jgi:hypothetical protein